MVSAHGAQLRDARVSARDRWCHGILTVHVRTRCRRLLRVLFCRSSDTIVCFVQLWDVAGVVPTVGPSSESSLEFAASPKECLQIGDLLVYNKASVDPQAEAAPDSAEQQLALPGWCSPQRLDGVCHSVPGGAVAFDLRINPGLAGRRPRDDIVGNRVRRFHSRRSCRHAPDGNTDDVRLLAQQPLDNGCGDVSFNDVATDNRRVARTQRRGHFPARLYRLEILNDVGLN